MALDSALFRDLLIKRRTELDEEDRISSVNRAPVKLDQESVGRLSRIDAMQLQAMALAQERRRMTQRHAIEAALARIEEGEFGYCVACGDSIGEARLRTNPAIVKCVECASGPR